jgi:tetraacyldisaccharide 4'-kinase
VVNPNRIAGAKKALNTHQPSVLILDDGFQHRKLRRDLDIVTVDATCPFGYGKILPAGLLREPLSGLSRASAVIITRTNQADANAVHELQAKISHAVSHPNRVIPLDTLKKEGVFAFCGIGNPGAFFDSIRQAGLTLHGVRTFDDHHTYSVADMEKIYEEAHACGAKVVLCTQKDWVKNALLVSEREGLVFAYLAMELDFLEGRDKMTSLINALFETEPTEKESQQHELC